MAIAASHVPMLAFQGEGGLAVVERRLLPARRGVAGRAVRAKLTLVGVVRLVAGVAVLGSTLQIGNRARPAVARGAIQGRVQPCKGKASWSWSNCAP